MRHVYRQVAGLKRHRSLVLTRKRTHPTEYPFPENDLVVLPRGGVVSREIGRIWHRQLRGSHLPASRREVSQILKVIDDSQVQVLHIYQGDVAATLLPLIRRVDVPVLVSFHGSDAAVEGKGKAGFRRGIAEVLDRADHVVARSDSLRNQLLRLGARDDRVTLQRTGIPLEDWPFSERTPPTDGQWKLLQIGRLVAKKGWPTSLRAFRMVRSEFPEAEFLVCGEGPMEAELRAMASELGIADAVTFLGFLDEPELLTQMENAHLYLHPSETTSEGDREGVPNSMLEAMATGLPVCATNHGGIPEALEEGVSGFLVEEGDEESLARAITRTLGDEKRARSLAASGRQGVEEKFGAEAQISALEDRYQSMMGDG